MRMNEKELTVMRQQPAKFMPLEPFEKPGTFSGLILPDGTKMMEINNVSGLVFGLYRKQLDAQAFMVHGLWVFTPNLDRITVFPKQNGSK